MCHVISGDCGCRSSVSTNVRGALVVLVALAGVSLAYTVMQVLWVPLLVLYLLALILASRRARRFLARFLRWLAHTAWQHWQARHGQPAPTRALAATDQSWHATVSAVTPGGTLALASGTVVGAWETAAHCEADVIARALRAYAERGETPPGQLLCRAEPLAVAR